MRNFKTGKKKKKEKNSDITKFNLHIDCNSFPRYKLISFKSKSNGRLTKKGMAEQMEFSLKFNKEDIQQFLVWSDLVWFGLVWFGLVSLFNGISTLVAY